MTAEGQRCHSLLIAIATHIISFLYIIVHPSYRTVPPSCRPKNLPVPRSAMRRTCTTVKFVCGARKPRYVSCRVVYRTIRSREIPARGQCRERNQRRVLWLVPRILACFACLGILTELLPFSKCRGLCFCFLGDRKKWPRPRCVFIGYCLWTTVRVYCATVGYFA